MRAMVGKLLTRTAQEIMTDPAVEEPMLIDGLMGGGLGFLCAAPKVGKSWLAMDISVRVATGQPLWGHDVMRGCVLHMPLEDTYPRLRKRLWLIAEEVDGPLHFAIHAEALGTGLMDQIDMFREEHPDLRLVVVDTLQMVRSTLRDYSYASDYRELSELKQFADERGLTVLMVHHTRKMADSDVMNMVSGTNGITGVADFTWVMAKDSRGSHDATLTVTGRDIEDRQLLLNFQDHRWRLVEEKTADDLAIESVPADVTATIDWARANAPWEGRTGELMELVGVCGMKAATYGIHLAKHSRHMERCGIVYSKRHVNSGSVLSLELVGDGCDGCDGSIRVYT